MGWRKQNRKRCNRSNAGAATNAAPQHRRRGVTDGKGHPTDGKGQTSPMEKVTPPMEKVTPPMEKVTPPMEKVTAAAQLPAHD
jgi:hypothetical protein